MEVLLSNGERIRFRWKYDQRDKQVRVTDSVLSKQKKTIYALGISLEEKRALCERLPEWETVKQDLTTCIVSDLEGEPLSEVTVTRWFKDPDNKPLARKTTFEMAIKAFKKEDKKIIWTSFLKTVRLPQKTRADKQQFYVVEVK